MNIVKADKIMHPAETGCWANERLVKNGFKTDTPPQQGFVREYFYTKGDLVVKVNTGVSADYWRCEKNGGYWRDLEKWLRSI